MPTDTHKSKPNRARHLTPASKPAPAGELCRSAEEARQMVSPLDPETHRRLRAVFRPGDQQAATAVLAATDFGLTNNLDRTRFAVLKISGGSLERLRAAVGLAEQDWRDAVVGAGFGDDPQAHLGWLADAEPGAAADGGGMPAFPDS